MHCADHRWPAKISQVLEAAAARFEDRLHLAKCRCVAGQRDRRIKVMDAVMLHPEHQDIAERTGEEPRISIAPFILRRMARRPVQEQRDVARADITGQPPDQRRFQRVACLGEHTRGHCRAEADTRGRLCGEEGLEPSLAGPEGAA